MDARSQSHPKPFLYSKSPNRISGKGKFTFEVGEDGEFTIAESHITEDDRDCKSETSSMEANACSIPDINSIEVDDLEDWNSSTALSWKPPPELLGPAERYKLIGGLGKWTEGCGYSEVSHMPWRIDAVSLEDLDDLDFSELSATPGSAENISRIKWPNPHAPAQNSQWTFRLGSRSIAESGTESLPALTEDCSRDSDSTGISEYFLNKDGLSSSNHIPEAHERKTPLSPELGSIGAFTSEFDQFSDLLESTFDTDKASNISGRPTDIYGLLHPEKDLEYSGSAEFDTLTVNSMDFDTSQSDTESTWMSDCSERTPALEIDHPFMLVKPIVVREGLLAFSASQQQQRPQGGAASSVGTGSTSTTASRDSGQKASKKRIRKKRAASEGSKESGDDDGAPEKRRRASKRTTGNQLSFACPFAKKDPLKYRGCYSYTLSRVRDVKQHLSRYHQLPIYCPRCMDIFETEDERDEHNKTIPCLAQNFRHEGVTRAQKAQLSERVSSTMTVEDQWFTIFDILFPGHTPRPRSPYMNAELTMELEGYQDFMLVQGPNIILSTIQSAGIHVSTQSNEERDLTALWHSAIHDGLLLISQRWFASYFPDRITTQTVAADGSSNSHASHAVDDSDLSRSSSNTLFDGAHPTDPAAEQVPLAPRENLFRESQNYTANQTNNQASEDWLDAFFEVHNYGGMEGAPGGAQPPDNAEDGLEQPAKEGNL